MYAEPIKPISAMAIDLSIGHNFSFFNSSSKAASKTIIIRPTVPKISKEPLKSGTSGIKNSNPILIKIPKTISISTAGMFVFLDIPLKKKDNTTIKDAPIIRLYEDKISIWLCFGWCLAKNKIIYRKDNFQ